MTRPTVSSDVFECGETQEFVRNAIFAVPGAIFVRAAVEQSSEQCERVDLHPQPEVDGAGRGQAGHRGVVCKQHPFTTYTSKLFFHFLSHLMHHPSINELLNQKGQREVRAANVGQNKKDRLQEACAGAAGTESASGKGPEGGQARDLPHLALPRPDT